MCHLSTTAHPIGALTKQNTGEWLEYFDLSRDDLTVACPKTILASLPELLKRIRKVNSAGDSGQGSRIALSDRELSWLSRLHDDVRNQFVHFAPMGWSLDVSGMAGLIALTGRLIREISSYGWAFRHEDNEWQAMLSNDLDTLERVSVQLFSDIAIQADTIA